MCFYEYEHQRTRKKMDLLAMASNLLAKAHARICARKDPPNTDLFDTVNEGSKVQERNTCATDRVPTTLQHANVTLNECEQCRFWIFYGSL